MRRGLMTVVVAMAGMWLAGVVRADEPAWPQFRGPGGNGVAENPKLPDRWSATENVAWKTDIPGRGWSSPVAWGDRVFLTTAVASGKMEEPKKGLYTGGGRPEPPKMEFEWWVYCLDLKSGAIVWKQMAHKGGPPGPIHLKNSYASETPATDGRRVYCYFGNLGIFAYEMDGKPAWSKPMTAHAIKNAWGTAASPVLHDGRVYIVNDNEEKSSLMALDAATGQTIWETERDEHSNWATPFIWQNSKRTEIVTAGTQKVRSYDLNGKLLWWFEGMSTFSIPTPYAHSDLLHVASGYVGCPKRPMYGIRAGAAGDISLKGKETTNEWIAWSMPVGGPYNPSTLGYQGRVYVLLDRGLLACYDAATGRAVFEAQRIPDGGAFTASPWAYNGKIFCLNESGVTFVFAGGDKFQLLRSNPLADDDMGMATPAMVGDSLLIRTSARVYCIRQAAGR